MYKNSNGWFPEDFDPRQQTLLIPESRLYTFDKKMKEILADYPYKYEYFNYRDTLKWRNESIDTARYKYALFERYWSFDEKDYGSMLSHEIYYSDFYFINRVTFKRYPPTGYYSRKNANYLVVKSIIKYLSELASK